MEKGFESRQIIFDCFRSLKEQQDFFRQEIKEARTDLEKSFAAGKLWGNKAAVLAVWNMEQRLIEACEMILKLKGKNSAAFQSGAKYAAVEFAKALSFLERADILRILEEAQKEEEINYGTYEI
jgi:hypothetical protein